MLDQKISLVILVVLAVIAVLFLILFIVSASKKSKLVKEIQKLNNESKLKDLSIEELKTDKESLQLDIKSLKSDNENLINTMNLCIEKFNKLNASIYKISDKIPEKVRDGFDINKKKHFMTCWMKLQNEAYEMGILSVEDGDIVLRVKKQ